MAPATTRTSAECGLIAPSAPHGARPGSRARPELAQGMRTYHLSFSRQRARGQGSILRKPRHFLVYRLRGDTHIEIVRVLHDAMDLERHLPDEQTLDDDDE